MQHQKAGNEPGDEAVTQNPQPTPAACLASLCGSKHAEHVSTHNHLYFLNFECSVRG